MTMVNYYSTMLSPLGAFEAELFIWYLYICLVAAFDERKCEKNMQGGLLILLLILKGEFSMAKNSTTHVTFQVLQTTSA